MKTILVINETNPQSEHALQCVLLMAKHVAANIIIANTCIVEKVAEPVLAGKMTPYINGEVFSDKPENDGLFRPEVKIMDISESDEVGLAAFVNQENIWMVVKGLADHDAPLSFPSKFNVNIFLNRSRCPVLLIPASWSFKEIERIAYIADLRYCRIRFAQYLAELAGHWSATLSIANVAMEGLPHMAEAYAMEFFSENISNHVPYDRFLLNHILERNLSRAVDVLVNGLHNDLIVLVNHHFHFEEIIGRHVTGNMPGLVTIPILLFPY